MDVCPYDNASTMLYHKSMLIRIDAGTVADPAAGERRDKKYEIYAAVLDSHLFMAYFTGS